MCGARLKRGGLWLLPLLLLLLPLSSGAQSVEEMTTEQIISELWESLNERELLLDEREQSLNDRGSLLNARESRLLKSEKRLEERQSLIDERARSLSEIESSLTATASSLESYDAAVRAEISKWQVIAGLLLAGLGASLIF